MGAIILSVLAFIGKLLLGLLLLLLLLILLILFVPIRYDAYASKQNDDINAKVRVTWLLRLIRFQFIYPEPGKPSLYIMFFDLLNRRPKKEKTRRKQRAKSKNETVPESDETEIPKDDSAESSAIDEQETNVKPPEDVTNSVVSEAASENAEENKQTIFQKLQSIPEKLKAIKEKILQTENKVETLQQKALYYWELIKEPDTIALFHKVKPAILKALKQILPRTIHVKATIGLGEPDTTAQVYGIAEIMIAYLRQDIEIIPELNDKKIEGEALVKGRLYLFVLLWEVIKLLLNKKLWKLIKKLKAGRKK